MGSKSSNPYISELQHNLIRMFNSHNIHIIKIWDGWMEKMTTQGYYINRLGVFLCFEQFHNRSQKICQSEVKLLSFFSDLTFWERELWDRICSSALLWPSLSSVLLAQTWLCPLFVPSFLPCWVLYLMEFARVSSPWELINSEPLSSLMCTSNQIALSAWSGKLLTKFRILELQIFTRDMAKNKARAYVVEWSNKGGNQDRWIFLLLMNVVL